MKMNTSLLITFIICNFLNVIIQTAKSLATINGSKFTAATVNALAYGFYTYIVVLMVSDLPMLWKALIIAGCNFIGVYIVKFIEGKMRKDKLWKVEMTVHKSQTAPLHDELETLGIPHNYLENIGKWSVFNCYCATQKESILVKEVADRHKAKYFVAESKTL